jgi:hypothetical protein
MDDSRTALKVREQLGNFLGIFSPRFPKPGVKFIGEIVYGLQASGNVKLSCIGRALGEGIRLEKTENRLSRNLAEEGMAGKVLDIVAAEAARHIRADTFIAVDPTDIRKLYARKMENLATVRDGDTGELVNGYWCCAAVACEAGSRKIVPLHWRLWASDAGDSASENREIFEVVRTIAAHAKRRGIYVLDRGGDRGEIFAHFLGNSRRFIVRLVGNRHLVFNRKKRLAEDLARTCPVTYREAVERETGKGIRRYTLELGERLVRLPDHMSTVLRMVVVRGYAEEPMILLTNVEGTASQKGLRFILDGYLARWRVEDTIRYVKQCYDLEDIRLLSYTRLRNMAALVLATAYFASAWIGRSLRRDILARNIARMSKRLYGVAEFCRYALADGIATLCRRYGKWKGTGAPDATPNPQLELPLFDTT